MASFIKWIAKNPALSFFFAAEAACLVVGTALVISNMLKPTEQAPLIRPALAQVVVIAEKGQQDFVMTEMEVFAQSQQAEYAMITTSRKKAMNEFAKNENAILILSDKLDEEEIASLQIRTERLPLSQEPIDHSFSDEDATRFFIRDNVHSVDEDRIAGFLSSNASQDLVFQKFLKKSGKRNLRNG